MSNTNAQQMSISETKHTIRHFEKNTSATPNATVLGLIKGSYEHAIEFTARAPGMNGMILWFGLLGSAFGFTFAYVVFGDFIGESNDLFMNIIGSAASCALVLFGIYSAVTGIRLELFHPVDLPTIFDRRNRKVYRIYRERPAGWLGLFRRWSVKCAEHDWALIDAVHQAVVSTTGSSVMRYHSLVFNVRNSCDDNTIVDSFSIGNGMVMGETTVPAVWEHIRRFMEEEGPHLPPSEAVRRIEASRTLWQCFTGTGPYGREFRSWWRDHRYFTILALIFSPIALPFVVLKSVCAWLGYTTSFPVEWPQNVRDALGASTHATLR